MGSLSAHTISMASVNIESTPAGPSQAVPPGCRAPPSRLSQLRRPSPPSRPVPPLQTKKQTRPSRHRPASNTGRDRRDRNTQAGYEWPSGPRTRSWAWGRSRVWPPPSLYHHYRCACLLCQVNWRTHVSQEASGLTLIQSSVNLWPEFLEDSERLREDHGYRARDAARLREIFSRARMSRSEQCRAEQHLSECGTRM